MTYPKSMLPQPHNTALVEFFKWAMREGPWDGCDLDGGGVQDKAESLGLIVKTQYDAEKHGVQGEFDHGDDYFVFAPGLDAVSAAKMPFKDGDALVTELIGEVDRAVKQAAREGGRYDTVIRHILNKHLLGIGPLADSSAVGSDLYWQARDIARTGGKEAAEVAKDLTAPSDWREPAAKQNIESETFVIDNPDGSISLDAYHGKTRKELKEHCRELVAAVDEWQFAAMHAATEGGNSLDNVREPHRSQIARLIDAYSDDEPKAHVPAGSEQVAWWENQYALAQSEIERLRAQVEELTAKLAATSPPRPSSVNYIPPEEDLALAFSYLLEKPSTSFIQRRMQIGYNRAAAIMETLENEGCVSPADSFGKRTILKRIRTPFPSTTCGAT